MKQTLLSFLLALMPLVASADAVEIGGIYYNLIPKGKVAEVTSMPSGKYTGVVEIPETVTYDGVTCNVTSIGESAFSNCSGLTSVTIPDSVTSIASSAFWGCSGLTSLTIGNSVTSIGTAAFFDCSSLTSVTIGNGIKTVSDKAFCNCVELTDVYCLAETVPSTNSTAFADSYIEYATLHVPAEAYNSYKKSACWSSFGTIVVIDGDVPGIEIPETPDPQKCATPTIAYKNGKLTFSCATEGVEYVSEVTVADAKKYYTNEVSLGTTYKVSVVAMKTGYVNSDTATMEINVGGPGGGPIGDLSGDGKVNAVDLTKMINILLGR